jgi:hypothetical protein
MILLNPFRRLLEMRGLGLGTCVKVEDVVAHVCGVAFGALILADLSLPLWGGRPGLARGAAADALQDAHPRGLSGRLSLSRHFSKPCRVFSVSLAKAQTEGVCLLGSLAPGPLSPDAVQGRCGSVVSTTWTRGPNRCEVVERRIFCGAPRESQQGSRLVKIIPRAWFDSRNTSPNADYAPIAHRR